MRKLMTLLRGIRKDAQEEDIQGTLKRLARKRSKAVRKEAKAILERWGESS